jgi:hypothetical protein
MATSRIQVTEGSGKNVATHSFSEDAVTKEVQRVNINSSAGAEIGTAGAPIRTDPTGTTAQPITDNGGSITIDGSISITGAVDTELPAAGALADNTANPTTTSVGTFPHWYDGATWDRAPGTSADGLLVNLGANNDVTVTSGTVNVGTVTTITNVVPVNDNSGSLTVDNATLSVVGGGAEATALRVTIANDSTGVLSIDDNSGSLTVDGTITANAGINLNTSALALESGGNLATIAGAIRAEDAGHSTGHTGIMALAVRQDTATQLAGTDTDYSPLITDANGRLHVNVGNTVTVGSHAVTNAGTFAVQNNGHGKTIISTGGSVASSGNNTLVAADVSNKIKVKAFSLTTLSTSAVTCIFQDGAGGTELWRVVLQAPSGVNTGANLAVPAPDWLFSTSVNTLLNLNLSAAQTVHWSVSYFKETS